MALTKVTGQVINTSTDVTVGVLTVTNTLAVGGTVSIGGTLTYEDVTNIDSVGLITARNGIIVGSGITLSKDGDIFTTGISTFGGNVSIGNVTPGGNPAGKNVFLCIGDSDSGIVQDGDGNIEIFANDTEIVNFNAVDGATFAGNILPSSDSSIDIGTNAVRFQNVYADTLYGDGSNLTGITQTTINNNADNRLITGSGTANTLEAESTITYDASLLNITSTTQGLGLRLKNTGNEYTNIQFDAARTSAGAALGIINAKWNNNHEVASIYLTAGDDTTNKDDGTIKFYTSPSGGSVVQRLNIDNNGNISIGGIDPVATSSAYDKASLHIHQTTSGSNYGSQIHLTSAHTGAAAGDGSQLSIYSTSLYINNQENGSTYFYNNGSPTATILANGNFGVGTQAPTKKIEVNGDILATSLYVGGSGSANQLDDYEEGIFTPALSMTSGGANLSYSYQHGNYTKVGNMVSIEIYIQLTGINANGSGDLIITGLPFTKTARYGGLNLHYVNNMNSVEITHALIDTSSTNVYLYRWNGSSVTPTTVAAALTTSSGLMLSGTYLAA